MSEDLQAIADSVMAMAKPGEEIEAVVVRGTDTEIRVYEGEIESLSSAQSQGVGIRVVKNGRQGFAWAGSLEKAAVAEVLAEARDNVEFATFDEFAGLATPDGVELSAVDLFRPGFSSVSVQEKIELAKELERAVRAADDRIAGIESAEYADGISEAAIATTTGIRSSGRETSCYLATYALATDGEETQTGFGYSIGREPNELDPQRAASEAAIRSTRLLGAKQPASGRFTLVLDPWVSAQFLGIIAHVLDGEAVLKGRSLFAGRLGEQVASPAFTFMDDPTDPRAMTATDTDGEGLAARRNVMIENGVLKKFVHNSSSARRAGTQSTGNAVRGFRSTPSVGCFATQLKPGLRAAEDIISGIEDGVLIQEVSGLHSGVNPVSGDFSTGAEGIRIRNGALAEPIREFTIASTLQKMLLDISEIGNDLTFLPMNAAGITLVVDDVTVSGS